MYKVPLNEIKEKIVASGKLTLEDLDEKIRTKINDLSGLISEEGAAHIIANELGVVLVKKENDLLKVKEIYPGMRSVNTFCKVIRKFDVKEFSKGDNTGKVCSLIVGDETGTIRLVFWNDKVDLISSVKENDILGIKDAYVRENNNGKEIHMGQKSDVDINPDGIDIGEVRKASAEFKRKNIQNLEDGESNVEIMCTVVQVFDPRFFYLCPQCNKRVNESGDNFVCAQHEIVKPNLSYVLNLILNDGTGDIRGVFWKNQVNHLLGKEETDIEGYKEDMAQFENVKTDLLGEQFKLKGRVKRNDMFDRLEFSVQIVEKANPQEELTQVEKVE